MAKRIPKINGEFYHVYNRGVDKRSIFEDQTDVLRFLTGLAAFNNVSPVQCLSNELSRPNYRGPTPIISRREHRQGKDNEKLVSVIAYHVLENHFHILLRQDTDGGLAEYMKRVGGGYTGYFNEKHERSGSLFQGKYKYVHVETDEYLRYLFAYINFNNTIHDSGFSFPLSSPIKSLLSSVRQYDDTKNSSNSNLLCDGACAASVVNVNEILHSGKLLAREIKERRDLKELFLE